MKFLLAAALGGLMLLFPLVPSQSWALFCDVELAACHAQRAALQNQVNALNAQIAQKNNQINALTTNVNQANSQIAALTNRSEEHTSELQSPYVISYAVF